jgi:ABC-type polysaccharide/polyol phosphate export permease
MLLLAPAAGLRLGPAALLASLGVMVPLSLAMTGLGLALAWRMESTQGFHAIMNLLLMPMWLLSGAFFPAEGAPAWLAWLMRANPMTYGMAALRRALYLGGVEPAGLPSMGVSLMVLSIFCIVTLAIASGLARRAAP